jgi:hypothetical protein
MSRTLLLISLVPQSEMNLPMYMPFANLVFKGIDKLTHVLERVYADELGFTTDKELSMDNSRTKCGSITFEGISGHSLLTALDVESRERGLVGVAYGVAKEGAGTTILCSFV